VAIRTGQKAPILFCLAPPFTGFVVLFHLVHFQLGTLGVVLRPDFRRVMAAMIYEVLIVAVADGEDAAADKDNEKLHAIGRGEG
jgi:hypothetical protein